MSALIAIDPTLAAAVVKIDRSLVYLKTPKADPVLLGNALDILKSASKLIASRRTVLVEMEDELPEPGSPLFDEAGAPAPGAFITSDDAILSMPASALETMDWNEEKRVHQDLLFAVRTHFRVRGFDLEKWHAFFSEMDKDIGISEAWEWIIQQVKSGGDFVWPHRCPGGCGLAIEAPEEGDDPSPCWPCQKKKKDEEAKEAKKAAKAKPAKKDKANPLKSEEGGGE